MQYAFEFDNQSVSDLHRTHLFDALSIASTISDLPGPGRTLDNVLLNTGRKLEKFLFLHVPRLRRKPKSTFNPTFLQFDDLSDLDPFFDNHVFEALSDGDDSTESGLQGPGLTVGKWISGAGRKLEKLLGAAGERMGKGPNTVINRTIALADTFISSLFSPSYPFVASNDVRSAVRTSFLPTVDRVTDQYFPEELIQKADFIDCCKKLVAFLRHDRQNNQMMAIYYLTSLICAYPTSGPLLNQLGAQDAVREVVLRCSLLPLKNRDRRLLLAPSRRALVMLSDVEVLTTIKKLDAAYEDHSCNMEARIQLFSNLVACTKNSNVAILAGRHLTTGTQVIGVAALIRLIPPSLLELWAQLAFSIDPLSSRVFLGLLNDLRLSYFRRSGNITPVLNIAISLLRQGLVAYDDTSKAPCFDFLARKLLKEITMGLQEHCVAANLSKEAVVEFSNVLQLRRAHLSPSDSSFLVPFIKYTSPFFEILGSFCREWYFRGPQTWYQSWNRIPMRAILPSRRTTLCRRLVELALGGECSAEDLHQIASKDPDCHLEILALPRDELQRSTESFRSKMSTLSQNLDIDEFRMPQRYVDGGFFDCCTGIRVTVPSDTVVGDSIILPPDIHGSHLHYVDRSGPLPPREGFRALFGDVSALRWISALNLGKFGTRYEPVVLYWIDGRAYHVGCKPNKDMELLEVLPVPVDLDPNQSRPSSLHILAVRVMNGGQIPDVFWYDKSNMCLTHAVTIESIDVPKGLGSKYCRDCQRTRNELA
ncbi:hypothetical protein JAAARDRAFT_73712 [Jaapia argillacea MUCL 33604]|uniref:Uncharacterized protein n=1 Tax=Jaapia argillacea MUCL 33604 TaxID=933084 RepID=A0A067PBK0_9AGAM|nr:hypothetical protein JAAARDRAFT_73712 [Jaapia argillacea MUCL 33604]